MVLDGSLVSLDKEIHNILPTVGLSSHDLSFNEVLSVSRNGALVDFQIDQKTKERLEWCYEKMMTDVRNGVPIYGCNTGYGGRAGHVVNKGTEQERVELAKKISEGIAHVDVSVGPVFGKDSIRAAMLIRIHALLQGVSAVKLNDLDVYRQMLNHQITPVVNQYGGIGASGDLAHNCRILNAARGLDGVRVWDKSGTIRLAKEILNKEKIPLLKLDPKAGLGFVNGDNVSTSQAFLLAVDTLESLLLSSVLGAMVIEVLCGTDRSFHPLLSTVRPHSGQGEVAKLYRYLLSESKLAYQEMKGHKPRKTGVKVQDGYSLRGISQYHGVNFEKIQSIFNTININMNSVSDNPLWVPKGLEVKGEAYGQWVSGGNFLAMYMGDAIDSLRKIMTQIVKLNDRHLARLVNPHESNGLPANLSSPEAVTQCAFKGTQIQSGMLDIYSSLLSIPVSTFFGIHEEGNQDITAHSLTSAILAHENLRLVRYSLAQNLIAVCQGVDLRGGVKYLSPKTRPVYEFVREKVKFVKSERPLSNDIEEVYEHIFSGEVSGLLRKEVLPGFLSYEE